MPKTPEEIADELKAKIETKHVEVLDRANDAVEQAKQAGQLATETKEKTAEVLTGLNEMREQLAQIEQKMARRPGEDDLEVKSFGEQVAAADKFMEFKNRGYQGSFKIELEQKEITAAETGRNWSQRDPFVAQLPQRRMTVRDLLTVVPTTSGSIDFAKQTTRTNAAAPVAESAAKPYSDFVWTQVSVTVRTIAHLAKLTRQALDDHAQLQGEVDQEMRYGLRYAEELQLLSGDGTGQNLSGLITNATAYSAPFDPAGTETFADIIFLGMLQAELALFPADGVIMNPADFARIRILKDANGQYLLGNIQGTIAPTLWGVPIVATPAMTIDKFLVGGFRLQTLYDRLAPEVLISSENVDDFEKNLYTMRCEERLALGVKRPAALIYGDLGAVA